MSKIFLQKLEMIAKMYEPGLELFSFNILYYIFIIIGTRDYIYISWTNCYFYGFLCSELLARRMVEVGCKVYSM